MGRMSKIPPGTRFKSIKSRNPFLAPILRISRNDRYPINDNANHLSRYSSRKVVRFHQISSISWIDVPAISSALDYRIERFVIALVSLHPGRRIAASKLSLPFLEDHCVPTVLSSSLPLSSSSSRFNDRAIFAQLFPIDFTNSLAQFLLPVKQFSSSEFIRSATEQRVCLFPRLIVSKELLYCRNVTRNENRVDSSHS